MMVDLVKGAWVLTLVVWSRIPDKMASLALLAAAVGLQNLDTDIDEAVISHQDLAPSESLVHHP